MKKKGFTLTEVLAVIALISLLLLIAVPSVAYMKKRINKRLFETEKDIILVAAEQYAVDNDSLFDSSTTGEIITNPGELLMFGYIEPDVIDVKSCPKDEYAYGCIIEPSSKKILNDVEILLVRSKRKYSAYWDETIHGEEVQDLLISICNKFGNNRYGKTTDGTQCTCTVLSNKDENGNIISLNDGATDCYFTEEDPNNWLYYSEKYFRILGIVKDNNKYYAKMITNEEE